MAQLWNMKYPGIYIDGKDKFFTATTQALNKLATLSLGNDLVTIISKRSQGIGTKASVKCVIRSGRHTLMSQMGPFAYRSQKPDTRLKSSLSNAPDVATTYTGTARKAVPGKPYTLPALGMSSVAMFSHDLDYSAELGIQTPAWLALAHELIHCMHFMSGDTNRYSDDGGEWSKGDTYTKHEEARTVGLGPYKNTRLSENSLRKEAKLPPRPYYDTPGDCDDLTSVVKP